MRSQSLVSGGTFTTTINIGSILTAINKAYRATLVLASIGGTTPTFDVTIESAPEGPDVTDVNATWETESTFAQRTTNGNETVSFSTQGYSRKRARIVVSGTSPTAVINVLIQ